MTKRKDKGDGGGGGEGKGVSGLEGPPSLIQQLDAARAISTPVVAVATMDPQALMVAICQAHVNEPVVAWDCVRGLVGMTAAGADAVKAITPKQFAGMGPPGLNVVEAFDLALSGGGKGFPADTILIAHNMHKFWIEGPVIQAVQNVRNPFKSDRRMLVMLAPVVMLPPELAQDVMTLMEPLPALAEVKDIIGGVIDAAEADLDGFERPDAETIERAAVMLKGLAAFPIEQATSLSVAERWRQGVKPMLHPPMLWERKRAFIQQTRGLTVDAGIGRYQDAGGLGAIKEFYSRLQKPALVVRVDEFEKMMAGAGGVGAAYGDSSGVSQDQQAVFLSSMEDYNWAGSLLIGPPGSGKTLFSRIYGNEFEIPVIQLDLGAMKGSLVGESEIYVRAAMAVLYAMGGEGVFFMATCNGIDRIPPEVQRRFRYGKWYFDLPDRAEKDVIWRLQLARYKHAADLELPGDHNWTGAEIRNCCELAQRMGCSLKEAARYIVPVAQSDPGAIERLRDLADEKFLSASYEGVFKKQRLPDPSELPMPSRKFASA